MKNSKFVITSSLNENEVNAYFDKYWKEQKLSVEYIVDAVRRVRKCYHGRR